MRKLALLSWVMGILGCGHSRQIRTAPPPGIATADSIGRAYADSLAVLRDAVVFFYIPDATGKLQPYGTGFLVAVPSRSKLNVSYIYLVTARHMVDGAWTGCPLSADGLILRLNKSFEAPAILELGVQTTVNYSLHDQIWQFPNDEFIDLAFTHLHEQSLNKLGAVIAPMKLNNFATKDEAENLRIGDEIVSAGLLPGASGNWRNFPIFKWGHISSVRGEPLPIPSQCGGRPYQFMSEVLISASLLPGNSGSPIVFLPNQFHPGRTFIAGVQSVSFIGSDVAGMAPIRAMIDKLRTMKEQGDLDLGPPDAAAVLPQNR